MERLVKSSMGIGLVACMTTMGCGDEERLSRDARQITAAEGSLRGVVQGNNAFAFALYDEVRKKESGNIFFSPFSISAAASMTYAGAKGDTAQQMRDVLRLQIPDTAYHEAFGALLADLGGPHGRGYELSIANRLFGQEGFAFNDDFLSLTANAYRAPLEAIDFGKAPEQARGHINAWVSEQTKGRIADLLPQGSVTPSTLLVLANAIYFHANWATAFDPKSTREMPFYVDSETSVSVPMMNRMGGQYPYAWNELVGALELPYRDDELSLVVLLPTERGGLRDVEDALSAEMVDELMDSLRETEIDLSFPKLAISYELPLKERLISMGMTNAFGDSADFGGIAQGLTLRHAVHQAFVQIDEHGTEAAAATALIGDDSAPPHFAANHPFLFFIRDRLTGSILFIGRVTNPAG